MSISTHILDTSRGLPADKVPVSLFKQEGAEWTLISKGLTNPDGRFSSGEVTPPESRTFKYQFAVEEYSTGLNNDSEPFYPFIEVRN